MGPRPVYQYAYNESHKRTEEGKEKAEIIFQETMADPYPNLMININLLIQKGQNKTLCEKDLKKTTL